jgi:hypothetical protein
MKASMKQENIMAGEIERIGEMIMSMKISGENVAKIIAAKWRQ